MTAALAVALVALATWIYLVAFRGGFWLARPSEGLDDAPVPQIVRWPTVVAIVPARNEAAMLPLSLASLLAQDYKGAFSVILVDDQSDDGTGQVARKLGEGAAREVTVVEGMPRPAGWTGKVWAMHQGLDFVATGSGHPDYVLLTDADIGYAPDALTRLVARAEGGKLVLTSLMAKLNCTSLAERALVPAFIFFFQMLYPFKWVGTQTRTTAAAAGGSMLIEWHALQRVGGMSVIRTALIDDCALAAHLKKQGPIWLGLTNRVRSLRAYPNFSDIRRMVARSAYAQLGYSPLILMATVAALLVTYAAPPVLTFGADYPASLAAGIAWLLMAAAFQPTLRFYERSWLWGLTLPAIAMAYMAFTVDSAYQHWRGRGGMWKGRAQALPEKR